MAAARVDTNASIESILSQQLDAVQQVLAFNQQISQRLMYERQRSSGDDTLPSPKATPTTSPKLSPRRLLPSATASSRLPIPQTATVGSRLPDGRISAGGRRIAPRRSEDSSQLVAPLLGTSKRQSDSALSSAEIPVHVPESRTQVVLKGPPPAGVVPHKPMEAQRPRSALHGDFNSKKMKRSDEMTHLFPRVSGVRNTVMGMLNKPRHNVEDLYHETGFFQAVAKSSWFNNFALFVIVCNTFWVAIDTDLNKASVLCEAPVIFQVVDNTFCVFFTCEMLIRFMSFAQKRVAFSDSWFVFDLFLVSLMIWETWVLVFMYIVMDVHPDSGARNPSILRVFRVFRLTRVARTARLLSSVPELMILAKGMFIAMRSVVAVLCLLALVIYVFGIIFVELFSGEAGAAVAGKFDNVPQSMNFLLLQVISGFNEDVLRALLDEGWPYYVLFLLFYIFASLTIMNMLIGILCDVVATVAESEKEDALVSEMENTITGLAISLDERQRHSISKEEFDKIIQYPEMTLALNDLGIDVVGLMDFAFFIFQECDELSYSDFQHMAFQFRRAKTATVKDVMDIRKQVSMQVLPDQGSGR